MCWAIREISALSFSLSLSREKKERQGCLPGDASGVRRPSGGHCRGPSGTSTYNGPRTSGRVITVQSPSPGLSGVGGSFSYKVLPQVSMEKRKSVEREGSESGGLAESVVGGAGLEVVVGGAEEDAAGASEVEAVVVVAEGGGVVVPVGSKLKRGSPNGKLAPPIWGV